MSSLRFIRITLTVALSSLCVVVQAQQPGGETAKSETSTSLAITGRVVDETGQPLSRAIVYVRLTGSSGLERSVVTDREGTFQVDGLDANSSYYVAASMPAYTAPSAEPAPSGPPTYRTGASVTLTLVKGGVVTGTVTNAAGDPITGIRVRAQMVLRVRNGRRSPTGNTREVETDDRGIYRIYGLTPGTYFVSAGGVGTSWSSQVIDPYDGDVPTYAPSSTRDTATEITVRAGEEAIGIDIRYRGEQGRVISGVVSGTNGNFSVILTGAGDGVVPSGGSYPEISGRTFSYIGIADGDYDLYAYSFTANREYGLSEVKRIRVRGADVTGLELLPRPLSTVAGRLVLEDTKAPECAGKPRPVFDETTVGAWHNDTEAAKDLPQSIWAFGTPVKPDAQGNFTVRNLAPGEYYFAVRTQAKNWYVRSIQFPGVKKPIDATRVWTNVKIGDQLSGLSITMAQGGASFRGQLALAEGEQVPARTFVYLAPVERERADSALNYFGTPVTAQGRIAMNNIVPGRYWIYAETLSEDAPVPLSRIRFPNDSETRAQIRRAAEAAKTEIEFKPCQDVVDFKVKRDVP